MAISGITSYVDGGSTSSLLGTLSDIGTSGEFPEGEKLPVETGETGRLGSHNVRKNKNLGRFSAFLSLFTPQPQKAAKSRSPDDVEAGKGGSRSRGEQPGLSKILPAVKEVLKECSLGKQLSGINLYADADAVGELVEQLVPRIASALKEANLFGRIVRIESESEGGLSDAAQYIIKGKARALIMVAAGDQVETKAKPLDYLVDLFFSPTESRERDAFKRSLEKEFSGGSQLKSSFKEAETSV